MAYIQEKPKLDIEIIGTLIELAALYSLAIGGIVAALSPSSFSIIWQHIFEIISIVLAGSLALATTEFTYGNYFDDREIYVFLTAYTLPLLAIAPLVQLQGLTSLPRAIELGIMGSIQATIGIAIVILLEKYTEFI